MKTEELNTRVVGEIEHIPRIEGATYQNLLRSVYHEIRRHDLAFDTSKPANETLRQAVERIRLRSPNFRPIYDKEFFVRRT